MLATVLLAAVTLISNPATPAPPAAKVSSVVPSDIRTSGDAPRVIVTATFNGHPMAMMVHSYSALFAQLKHGQAKAFGIELRPGTHRDYGIDRNGHVSQLGRDEGTARTLAVGRSVNYDAPVSVFEVPQDHYGMLGTGWIAANRVIVDFARSRVTVAPSPAQDDALRSSLISRGYVPLKMRFDQISHFYFVKATINGVARDMAVTTASDFMIDTEFASAAALRHGVDVGEGDGPTGTHVGNYKLATPVRVSIEGWTSPAISEGRIRDSYAYIASKRPANPADTIGGSLGGPFLSRSAAVVDFGSLTLFVKGRDRR